MKNSSLPKFTTQRLRTGVIAAFILSIFAITTQYMMSPPPVQGLSNGIVISQVYGGGGNSGATLRNDFIELFNRGTATVNIAGWSVQYNSATGTGTWQVTTLSGSIPPGGYYLVQEAQGAGGTVNLPTPDAIGTILMSGTTGKVALLNNSTALTGACPVTANAAGLIDFVGYGSLATTTNFCFEGAGPTAALTNTTAAIRLMNGCMETDNNSTDFNTGAPTPRNSASPASPCQTNLSGVGAATPSTVSVGAMTLLTVTVSPGSNPTSSGIVVNADLSSIGGLNNQQFFDDGMTAVNGDVTAGDNIFSFRATVALNTTTGAKTLPVMISDAQNRTATASIMLTVVPADNTVAINVIQGSGSMSPLVGQIVTTATSIVTGVKSNGFFIQTPDVSSKNDNNTATSEGIFVFTSSTPPASAVIGNAVQVTGTVVEFVPSQDPFQPPLTEIGGSPTVELISMSNALPMPILLTADLMSPSGSIEQLEKFEGMRVMVNSLTVCGPTLGNVDEPNATATSTGVFFGFITPNTRPFREPGIEVPDPLPAEAPSSNNIPRFDANPERLRIDSDGQTGASAIDVSAGQMVTGLVGPLDYSFRTYTILPDLATPPTVTGSVTVAPLPMPTENQITVASYNIERFFDTVNDPIGDPVLSSTAFNNRLNKISLFVRNILRTPDIIGTIEIENISALQALASRINSDAVAASQPNPNYQAYLEEGNDVGGIDVGFLVKSSRVNVVDVTQEGKNATFINPNNNQPETLNDRPPLVLRAAMQTMNNTQFPITVIVNHLRSLNGVDDVTDGPRVRAKRRAQAEFLANLVQARQTANPNERIVVVGDFNAFQFNDGYVDSMGTIKGTPTPAAEVTTASSDLVSPDLINLVENAAADQRYSFVFDGNAQVLDHHLITQNLNGLIDKFVYARANADFAETLRNDATTSIRTTDHDVPVTYFNFPIATQTALMSSLNPSIFGNSVTFTATVTSGTPAAPVTQGMVTFKDGDMLLGSVMVDAMGKAVFMTSALNAGMRTINAEYGGSGNLDVSSAMLTQTVNPADTSTTVTSSLNPSGFGQPVTFTAEVTSATATVNQGSVTFKEGDATLGGPMNVDSTGKASFTTSALSIGSHVVTAAYSSSGNFNPSMGSVTQNVMPGLSINDVSVNESNAPFTVAATFTVTLSAPLNQTVTIDFATANRSALAGIDYTAKSGTITFAPGTTTQTIAVVVLSDGISENDENFFVNLSNAVNAVITDPQGFGTIKDNDPNTGMTITDATILETNAGTSIMNFTVRLSAANGKFVSVDYTTADGTATSPADYMPTSGKLTFNPGETTKNISVTIVNDTLREGPENFLVDLSNLINADMIDSLGIGNITDNDPIPQLKISDVTVTEPVGGSVNAVFTVALSAASGQDVAVAFSAKNGTAQAGSDYTVILGTLNFPAGTTQQNITVKVLADAVKEISESFAMTLATPLNSVIADSAGVCTIFDVNRPYVNSFSSTSGPTGSTVTITGLNFTTITSVKLNNIPAAFKTVNTTTITFTVPTTATSGQISVSNAQGTGVSDDSFTVTPGITSFSPTSGIVGAQISIIGTNLTGATKVLFAGSNGPVEAPIISPLATSVRTVIPAGAVTGKISVITPGGTGVSAADFRMLPKMNAIAPASAPVGATVAITGTSFSKTSSVKFNNVAAQFTLDSNSPDSKLIAVIPAGATTGRVSLTITDQFGSFTIFSATNFGVLPAITSLLTTSGTTGTEVIISGTTLIGLTSVKFNGVAASFSVLTTPEPAVIRAIVPMTATSGKITLTNIAGTVESVEIFKVMPKITTFSPATAKPGTLVTILGSGFGPTGTAGMAVAFGNGESTSITVVSPTMVRAIVPSSATKGKILVTTQEGSAASPSDFTPLAP